MVGAWFLWMGGVPWLDKPAILCLLNVQWIEQHFINPHLHPSRTEYTGHGICWSQAVECLMMLVPLHDYRWDVPALMISQDDKHHGVGHMGPCILPQATTGPHTQDFCWGSLRLQTSLASIVVNKEAIEFYWTSVWPNFFGALQHVLIISLFCFTNSYIWVKNGMWVSWTLQWSIWGCNGHLINETL